MMGATNPLEAAPGTVQGDFGLDMRRNVVHSADSLASAEREIAIFFPEGGELTLSPDSLERSSDHGRPPFPADFQLVLASQSPRRHSLLRDVGVPFTVVPSEAEEVLEGDRCRRLGREERAGQGARR